MPNTYARLYLFYEFYIFLFRFKLEIQNHNFDFGYAYIIFYHRRWGLLPLCEKCYGTKYFPQIMSDKILIIDNI